MFKRFDESIFREFRSSTKEGLNDIALDDEEIDKIEFEVSQSRKGATLRVDYTDFSNHVYFGSALAATNFSLARILNDYPIDGEFKEKNEWHRVNSGFENWFFDNYPKQQGYMFVTSGSSEAWVELDDHEEKMKPHTGSVLIEAVVKGFDDLGTEPKQTIFSFKEYDDSLGFSLYLSASSGNKFVVFDIASGSTTAALSASYNSYISSSHMVSVVYDQPAQKQIIYIDGIQSISQSLSADFPSGIDEINILSKKAYIGAMSSSAGFGNYFTGAIDDVRYWTGPTRKPTLIKRNYFKPISANISGGLKLYYKFNETSIIGNNVFDYSGNELHGTFTGSFTFSSNIISGTLGPWFKDSGEPIYDLANSRVDTFLDTYRTSGSNYDRANRNFIFKLVPSYFIDDAEAHDEMQRFLLMMARHYDQLKLYIEHLTNVYNTSQGDYNNTPDELIGLVAQHYGLDLGSVYEGASALSYFFGEDVNSTGSLDSSVKLIRNQLRRNLLDNLIYVIKTKSTREALEASLRSLGLEENIVNINEYSNLSGGIETTFTPRTVEKRVFNMLTSSNVILSSSLYSNTENRCYEVRVLFNTGSTYLTSSIFTIASGASGEPIFYVDVERENLTSSNAIAKLYHSGATTVTSSLWPMYDNNWINFFVIRDPGVGFYRLIVSKLNRDEVEFFDQSASGTIPAITASIDSITTASLGSRTSTFFEGCMQEFRTWAISDVSTLTSPDIQKHTEDFDSLFLGTSTLQSIDDIRYHLKLNDFTSSLDSTAPAHDYVDNHSGFSFTGLSSSAEFNFPGKYIDKLEPSYSYDFGVNNQKIRTRSGSVFSKNDIIEDVPYLSVDMSPIISLNKEIVKWFGPLEKFNNLVGFPYYRYRDELDSLNDIRYKFFNARLTDKVKFNKYLQLLKWFDSNFTFFLSQLIPLDLGHSLSNFVIESHLLEYNQVPRVFPFKKDSSLGISGTINALATMDVALQGEDIPFGDPGRFGAATSGSGDISSTETFMTSSVTGSSAVNFRNSLVRETYNSFMMGNSSSFSPEGYGNGFHTLIVTGANYLKNTLNVDENFMITSSIHFSAANGPLPLNTFVTGTFNGILDQRWLWHDQDLSDLGFGYNPPDYDFGIGYGGAFGQLWKFSNKSIRGSTVLLTSSVGASQAFLVSLGGQFYKEEYSSQEVLKITEKTDETITHVVWPYLNEYEPLLIQYQGSTTGSYRKNNVENGVNTWGEPFSIEGYNHINISLKCKRVAYSLDASAYSLRFIFKFQFSEQSFMGNDDIDGALSSSFDSSVSSYKTEKVDHEYSFVKTVPAEGIAPHSGSHEFTINFERELPKAKYMRTFFRFEIQNNMRVAYKTQVKGTLYKETNTTQERILKERS